MKKTVKTIAFILLLTLAVMTIFACSDKTTNKDSATSKSITESNNNSSAKKDDSGPSQPNLQEGFYFMNYDPISVGTFIPKKSSLAFLDADGSIKVPFTVDDGHQRIELYNWYGSGNTQYKVKKIEDRTIILEEEKNFVPQKVIIKGFYFKNKDGEPDANNKIIYNTFIPKNSELAYFNENAQISHFTVNDGNKYLELDSWYGSGDTEYYVTYVEDGKIFLKKK